MVDATNGIFIFVTSFLGLAFLIAAGCIIYIKQMDETEDEIDNFKVLRRIGFTNSDMSKGLLLKILFNFGLPFNYSSTTCVICGTSLYACYGQCNNGTCIPSNDCLHSHLPHLCSYSIYTLKSCH